MKRDVLSIGELRVAVTALKPNARIYSDVLGDIRNVLARGPGAIVLSISGKKPLRRNGFLAQLSEAERIAGPGAVVAIYDPHYAITGISAEQFGDDLWLATAFAEGATE